jgi:hypothetical protein
LTFDGLKHMPFATIPGMSVRLPVASAPLVGTRLPASVCAVLDNIRQVGTHSDRWLLGKNVQCDRLEVWLDCWARRYRQVARFSCERLVT